MRHLQGSCMWLQMIVDPTGEDGGFHRRCPWLRKHLHPSVQIPSCSGNATFGLTDAASILHAVADRFLVNIQSDVIHTLHGGASLVVSESARSLSSAFVHQALLHDLYIQTIRHLTRPKCPGRQTGLYSLLRKSPDSARLLRSCDLSYLNALQVGHAVCIVETAIPRNLH